jgi:hypothetical protein
VDHLTKKYLLVPIASLLTFSLGRTQSDREYLPHYLLFNKVKTSLSVLGTLYIGEDAGGSFGMEHSLHCRHLYFVARGADPQKSAVEVNDLSPLRGRVLLKTKGDALEFVRLLTGISSTDLFWPQQLCELTTYSSLSPAFFVTDPQPRAHFVDAYTKGAYPAGETGLFPDAWDKFGELHPTIEKVHGGFVITRALCVTSLRAYIKTGIYEERVSEGGSYKCTFKRPLRNPWLSNSVHLFRTDKSARWRLP